MSAQPLYLEAGGEAFLAFLHDPRDGCGSRAVLLCPQLGWDDVCAYRSRFEWAERLAAHGFTAMRLDLPGTGDSPGQHDDPRRLEAWTKAIGEAARTLGERGAARVAAVGIGAGGLVLWRAVTAGAPVDELVLWAVPAKGRLAVRELKAFAQVEEQALGIGEGQFAAGGFPQSDELLADLGALDLTALPLPRDVRVLLLERDTLPVDEALVETLDRAGIEVTTGPGTGYGEMLAEPAFAQPPHAVFELVESWLGGAGSLLPRDASEPGTAAVDERVSERTLAVDHAGRRLLGVLAEPEQQRERVCAVLLNAGAIRRIGPNRMWVELARRWAGLGVPTLRLDFAGIGDAEGNGRFADVASLYQPEFAGQISAALDVLQQELGAQRFVLTGLCSGGYWAFQGALDDPRVVASASINAGVLEWSPLLLRDRRLQPLRASLRRHELGQLPDLTRVIARRLRGKAARAFGGDSLTKSFDRLRDRDTKVLLLFAELEPQLHELKRDGHLTALDRWPNMTVERLPGRDHTLRPRPMQEQAHAALDQMLTAVLRETGNASG
jgi:alpha-beta hydrolase superfamily lysophospholipase